MTAFPLRTTGRRLRAAPNSGSPSVAEWEKQTGLKRDEYFATIPSLPISYDTAHEIFKVLAGPNVPSGWQGGLPLAYHVGPGPAEVSMSVAMDYQIRKIWNVIATIPGTVEPDRWVMVGNHRDAWVYGAVDPGSGTAATLEMCRALGCGREERLEAAANARLRELGRRGVRPGRLDRVGRGTRQAIDEKAVLMLNVDSAVSGPELEMSGVPSLRDLVLGRGRVDHRPANRQVAARRLDRSPPRGLGERAPAGPRRPALGSRLVGECADQALEPGLRPADGLARLGVRLHGVPRPSGSAGRRRRLQWRLWGLSLDLRRLQLDGKVRRSRVPVARHGRPALHADRDAGRGRRRRAAQVRAVRPGPARTRRRAAPHEGPARAEEAIRQDPATRSSSPGWPVWSRPSARFRSRPRSSTGRPRQLRHPRTTAPETLARLNDALAKVERAFLLEEGLPGRPWFKHAVYAPGLTTGYAAWPLPAIRQALEEEKTPDAKLAADVARTVERINKAAAGHWKLHASAPESVSDEK